MPLELDQDQLQKELEEKRKRENAVYEQRLNDIQNRLMGQSPQVDQVYLSPDELKNYKSRLTSNLDKREELRDYLMGMLFKKTIDPTDPMADMIVERTPGKMAKEFRQEDRAGKSKIGNFFRDIDYALSNYGTRDRQIASNRQKEAMQLLDNVLKDQGGEIQRGFGMQNTMAKANADREQKGVIAGANIAQKQQDMDQKEAARAQTFDQLRKVTDAKIGRMDSQNQMDIWRRQFSPFGQGGSKELQDAKLLYNMEKNGDKEGAAKLRKELQDSRAQKLLMELAGKGGFGSTRNQVIQGTDANGNLLIKNVPVTTTPGENPFRQMFMDQLQRDKGAAPNSPTQVKSPQNVAQNLTQEAVNQTSPKKAVAVVNKALENAASDSQKQYIAAQGLTKGLTADQIKNDAIKAKMGGQYTIEDAPLGDGVVNTGMKKTGAAGKDIKEWADMDSKITSGTTELLKFASTGKLNKVFGPGNNWLSTMTALSKAAPFGIGKLIAPGNSDNPTHEVERMYPGITKSSDPDVQRFVNTMESLIPAAKAAVQLLETGKVTNEQEMERLNLRFPKITDTPEVAVQKLVSTAITIRMTSYLASKNYTREQIQKINSYMGAYLTPRVKEISDKVFNGRALNANGVIGSPSDVVRDINLRALDPEDTIGVALENAAKQSGVPFDDLVKSVGLKARKLVPDNSPAIGTPQSAEDRLNQIRKKYGVK